MPSPHRNSIRISHHAKTGKQSRVRAQFDTLIRQLEVQRERLAAWHVAIPKMQSRANAELVPLSRQYDARCREMIFLFDKACESKHIKKRERAKLSDLICSLSVRVLHGGKDDELANVFKRHSWGGIEDPKDDPEFASFCEQIDHYFNGPASSGAPPDDPQTSSTHKGKARKQASHKETAHQARQAAEEQRLQQSVRDIFRKLTSSLHPDREQDQGERERKTALMQRVNVAYNANDLLGLLELQFEIEQIDQAGLDTLPEERIRQFNKLLNRQVAEVRRDIAELEFWLMYEIGVAPTRGQITPGLLETALLTEIAELKMQLAAIEHDLQDFQDIGMLKAYLKNYRIPDMPRMFDPDYF